jgi:16S rRNA (guanine527-N7)-methyltransferase
MTDDDLVHVLSEIQRRGAIGRTPIVEAIAHADRYVAALSCATPALATQHLVDLGSGGGLPGLVIAFRRRDLAVTLVERRSKRADLLRYGVRALDLTESVIVVDGDSATLADVLASQPDPVRRAVDVVTARSYGPPLVVLAVATPLLRAGGVVLISEPPLGGSTLERWTASDLRTLGVVDDGAREGIRRFHVEPLA